MNLLYHSVKVSLEHGHKPKGVLWFAMLFLRGGSAQRDDLLADCEAWQDERGEPTADKLLSWAEGMEVESRIAEPLVRAYRERVRGGEFTPPSVSQQPRPEGYEQ